APNPPLLQKASALPKFSPPRTFPAHAQKSAHTLSPIPKPARASRPTRKLPPPSPAPSPPSAPVSETENPFRTSPSASASHPLPTRNFQTFSPTARSAPPDSPNLPSSYN